MWLIYMTHPDGRDGYVKEEPGAGQVVQLCNARYDAYTWFTRDDANDALTTVILRSVAPGWNAMIMGYYDAALNLIDNSYEKPVAKPICVCHKCGEPNEYAEPNLPDGRYICPSDRRYGKAW